MRIISGMYGGRVLSAPPSGSDFRPTTDRVRESLFNILEHSNGFDGATVLDLFAGTGALGIEALSRGASHAVFVEKTSAHAGVIKRNIAALGIEKQASVVLLPAEKYLRAAEGKFDIVFCDPPYSYTGADALLETIAQRGLLCEGGVFCLEHSAKTALEPPPGWRMRSARGYGTTAITLLEIFHE